MKYAGYKLDFTTAVHIGKNKLEDAEHIINADTIFSALCQEALLSGGNPLLEELIDRVNENKIRISDALPFNHNTYYLPKPMLYVNNEKNQNVRLKKEFKKLECIPSDKIVDFLEGNIDVKFESDVYKNIGSSYIRTMAAIGDETSPFSVGTFTFGNGWGLYLIIGYLENTDLSLIEELLIGIGYSGIGGKKSSGLGKFNLLNAKLPESLLIKLQCESDKPGTYMSLSVSMPAESELEDVLVGSQYSVIRRSGFVSSATYSEKMLKKKDAYFFKAGSTFIRTFNGVVKDVSNDGKHPVLRYAKPIFLEVR